jgi:hypothetical protein
VSQKTFPTGQWYTVRAKIKRKSPTKKSRKTSPKKVMASLKIKNNVFKY